jgi:hypothetical protein
MALPQHEVFDPAGKLVGVYETRADAEHAIERDVQSKASGYVIDDSKWRAAEQAERDAEYKTIEVEAAKVKLAAEAERQAEQKAAAALVKKADAEAEAVRKAQLKAEQLAAEAELETAAALAKK